MSIKDKLQAGESIAFGGVDTDIQRIMKILEGFNIYCFVEKLYVVKNLRYTFNSRGEAIGIEPSEHIHTGYMLKKVNTNKYVAGCDPYDGSPNIQIIPNKYSKS